MNMYTDEIMRLAEVNKQEALAIQEQMEINGIDYSECSDRDFRLAMREAQIDLWGVMQEAF